MRKIPIYPFLFSLFPIISLYVVNANEVNLNFMLRPILGSLAFSVILFGLLWLLLRKIHVSAIISLLALVLFFTYGHIYYALRTIPSIGMEISRHRYLLPLYMVIFVVVYWLIIKNVNKINRLCLPLNVICIILILVPVISTTSFLIQSAKTEQATINFQGYEQPINPNNVSLKPDIYYIILDSYTRQDALLSEFNFDNSDFLSKLKDLGFYVAECSRSNYFETQSSLTSSLNLNYMGDIGQIARENVIEGRVWELIKESLVRDSLAKLGYKTVAFATTYPWTEITNADYYFSPHKGLDFYGYLTPFERLLIKTTAGASILDLTTKLAFSKANDQINGSPFAFHIQTELSILNELPKVPSIAGPKFVFAHIIITHGPPVFLPDGTITNDPNILGTDSIPVTPEYNRLGYINEIQFTNSQILKIVSTIIRDSKVPPVIIIQGDHGFQGDNRSLILNAYYMKDEAKKNLYPTITPVNSFRIMFNYYFNTTYEILTDLVYTQESQGTPVPETSSACLQYYK